MLSAAAFAFAVAFPSEPATAVVTVRDVPAGEPLTEELLRLAPPRGIAIGGPPRAVGQLVGRAPRERLLAGEAVRFERLVDPERGFGLQALVDPGTRAVRVRVPSVLGIEPGAHVQLKETWIPVEGESATLSLATPLPVLAVEKDPPAIVVHTSPAIALHLSRPMPRVAGIVNAIDVSGQENHGPVLIEDPNQAGGRTVVARRELHPGLPIREEDVVTVEGDGELGRDWVLGRYVRERILPGEVVRGERLADPLAAVGLHAILPRGMVGAAVPLPHADRTIRPGNYVDVATSIAELRQTVMLLQAVFVVAIDRHDVMLLLTPDQAEKVAHAYAVGTALTLVLRSDLDVEIAELSTEAWDRPSEDEPKRRRRRGR